LEHYAVCDPVNVATGKITSIKEVARIILDESGHPTTKIVLDDSKPSGPSAKRLDIAKMKQQGFAPSISLRDGLRETINWFKETYRAEL
jgi:nucleoside-diphosphate-sugar epimerase